jgi:hypothetical protein
MTIHDEMLAQRNRERSQYIIGQEHNLARWVKSLGRGDGPRAAMATMWIRIILM